MDYLFRLADGRRLALWSERNQIIRQLSGGGGNRSHITLRTDFLSDLAAVSLAGRIYFVYQNTARMVVLYLPDAEGDLPLFGESIESCRHSGLTLTVWENSLYLFYTAWSPIREKYSLKVRKLSVVGLTNENTGIGGTNAVAGSTIGNNAGVGGFGDSEETVLAQEFDEMPRFQLVSEAGQLLVIAAKQCWHLSAGETGGWQAGEWLELEKIEAWKRTEEKAQREAERQTAQCRRLEGECRQLQEECRRMEEECRRLERENRLLTEETRRLVEESEKLGLELKHAREEGEVLREERRKAQQERKKEQQERQKEQQERQKEQQERQKEQQERQREAQEREQETERYRSQLKSAVKQYNELAEVARQLQIEGKKWKEKYQQEVKKRKDRTETGRNRRAEE